MEIQSVLEQFGLKEREIKVYLACLELGSTTVLQIAKKTGLKRPTVYDILEVLKNKGLVGQSIKGKKRLIYAEEPEKLSKLLEEKEQQLQGIMPMLRSLYNVSGDKPKIRYFEGKEDLKNIYRDTIKYPDSELLAFVTEHAIEKLGLDFLRAYVKDRKKHNIKVRSLAADTKHMRQVYKKTARDMMRTVRLVDAKEFPFSIEMNIYGNKVAFFSFVEEMGVIVESNDIAKNMRFLFELAWKGAK